MNSASGGNERFRDTKIRYSATGDAFCRGCWLARPVLTSGCAWRGWAAWRVTWAGGGGRHDHACLSRHCPGAADNPSPSWPQDSGIAGVWCRGRARRDQGRPGVGEGPGAGVPLPEASRRGAIPASARWQRPKGVTLPTPLEGVPLGWGEQRLVMGVLGAASAHSTDQPSTIAASPSHPMKARPVRLSKPDVY